MAEPYGNPPPSVVLYVSSKVRIAAPAAHVFALFLDTATWPEWNSFIPRAELAHAKGASPVTPTTITKRDTMTMHVRLKPGQALTTQALTVTAVKDKDELNGEMYSASWSVKGYPSFLIRTDRTTEVVILGEEECEFRTWDAMFGTGARIAKTVNPGEEELQKRFIEHANDIKAYAEKTWAEKKDAAP